MKLVRFHPGLLVQAIVVLFTCWGTLFGEENTQEHLSFDLLFRANQVNQIALSPDGLKIVYDYRKEGVLLIGIYDIVSGENKLLQLWEDEKKNSKNKKAKESKTITGLKWLSSERLLVSVDHSVIMAVNSDGSNFKALMKRRTFREELSEHDLREALIEAMIEENDAYYDDDDTDELTADFNFADRMLQFDSFRSSLQSNRDFLGANRKSVGEISYGNLRVFLEYPQIVNLLPDDPRHILVAMTPPGGYAVHDLNYSPNMPGKKERYERLMKRSTFRIMGQTMRSAFPELEAVAYANEDFNKPPLIYELYKVDINSGKRKEVYIPNRNVTSWLTDRQGRLRLGVEHIRTRRRVIYKDIKSSNWKPLEKILSGTQLDSFDFNPDTYLGRRCRVLGFDYDPNILYIASNLRHNTLAIYACDLATGRVTELIHHDVLDLADPMMVIDQDALVFHESESKLVGVRFRSGNSDIVWLDPWFVRVQASLNEYFPNHQNVIINWDDKAEVFLVFSSSGNDPGRYLIFNTHQQKIAEYFSAAPWLTPDNLSKMHTFEIVGSHGRNVRGYLTIPAQADKLPLSVVVYPHDGPWSRNHLGFDRNVQALAAMGYVVLQVNFVGSMGYGYEHLSGIRNAYSEGPLQDLDDAVKWIIDSGVGNPDKIAIMGFGYGGYLSLMALATREEMYRCGVAISSPVNLPQYLAGEENPFLRNFMNGMIGAKGKQLSEISPHTYISSLHDPILLISGDRRAGSSFGLFPKLRYRVMTTLKDNEFLRVDSEDYKDWYASTQVRVFDKIERFIDAEFNRPIPVFEFGPLEIIGTID